MTPETESNPNKVMLVDGTALAYRSHFAFIRSPLTTSKGQDVSATFGFISSLLKLIEREEPGYLAVAFDTPEPTFRHKKYADYKATREKTPDELIEQFPYIRQVTEALGITVVEVPGWEADDVLGTLAVQAAAEEHPVYLVTGDKDFMQLVSDRIQIYNPARSEADSPIQGKEAVLDKFGVEPERVIEVMGLMGDSSDNIPGVPGVGPKTAIKLILDHGTIDQVYRNLDAIKGKGLKDKLEKNRDLAFLSRELVTIDRNVPLEIVLADLDRKDRDLPRLREILLELEFNSLLDRLTEKKEAPHPEERDYILVDSEEVHDALMKKLKKTDFLVLDLETTSLDPLKADIVGISLSLKEGEAYYLPANLMKPVFKGEKDLHRFLADLQEVLADPKIEIGGQNIKYDLKVLARAGVKEVRGVTFDTMVAHYLLFPTGARHNLDMMSLEHLNVKKIPTSDLIGKGKKQISMADVPVETVCEYACEDADMTLRLKNLFEPKLKEMPGLHDLFRKVEMPLVRVLEAMELAGVKIDMKMLEAMSKTMRKRLLQVSEEIYEMAGECFNINSTQQLGKLLFEKLELQKELGMKRVKKTKTGYSTNAAVLESMIAHPLPRILLEYRQLQKLQSTYVDALPQMVNASTGRIHGSFNQTVTATGRLSSSDPNLQNIPIRTELGRKIRQAFIPGNENSLLLCADYSQIELRILAHVSQDPALVEAFQQGDDIHRRTAALIFQVAPEEVTPDMRARAKTINFGIIYGMGPHRLSREIDIPFGEAQDFIASYFGVFAGVKGYIDRTLAEAREKGFVTTLLGRIRRIEEINATNQQVRNAAENMAVNTPIQGTAADLIKVAMVDIFHTLQEKKLKSAMILQVHDELVFDVPKDEMEIMEAMVREKMEGALELRVPIKVDMGWGKNWLEAH